MSSKQHGNRAAAAAVDDAEPIPLFLDKEQQDSDDRREIAMGETRVTSLKGSYGFASTSETSRIQVCFFIFVFCFGTVGSEFAFKGAMTEFASVGSIDSSVSLFQLAFCLMLPLIVTRGRALQRFPRSPREAMPYGMLCLALFGATELTFYILRLVTYPTFRVCKSSKLIPTMMVSTFLQGKRYGWLDYVAAVLLCVGAAGYAMDSTVNLIFNRESSVPGLALLFVSVLCDAIVPNLQERFMTPPDPLSASELMVNVHAIAFALRLVLLPGSGELSEAIQNCFEYPRLSMYLTLHALSFSAASLAYIQLIQASGSVTAVAVATLRNVVIVVLSYIFFPKPLRGIHIIAGIAVLGGILLSTMRKSGT